MTHTTTDKATPPTRSEGTLTSLAQLFSQPINDAQVQAIEIPLFQRDYAQGRKSEQARHVRERFISTCAPRWTAMAKASTSTSSLATW